MNGRTRALLLSTISVCIAVVGSAACSVEQTREGEAPDVDVDVDPGRWPRYDVSWADVDVGTRQQTVTVPVVRVERETREVTVPYIDINPPGAGEREERTVSVELDVPSPAYQLRIEEIRAAEDDLWVVARLAESEAATGGPTRVSDQVVVNAPSDLDVRKAVVGMRPAGVYNQQYRFFDSMTALEAQIPSGARVLYQRGAGDAGAAP